jgi:hypothetical protein
MEEIIKVKKFIRATLNIAKKYHTQLNDLRCKLLLSLVVIYTWCHIFIAILRVIILNVAMLNSNMLNWHHE